MFIIGHLFIAIAKVASLVINIYYFLIILRALLSWISPITTNTFTIVLHNLTEPLLGFLRKHTNRYLPQLTFDISPIIAILALYFVDLFLVQSLLELGRRLT